MNAVTRALIAAPYHPPTLSQAEAVLASCFAARRWPIPLGDGELSLVPPPAHVPDAMCMGVTFGAELARCFLPRQCVDRMLATLDPAASKAAADVLPLLLELVIEPFLSGLDAVLPVTLGPDPGELPSIMPLGLRWRDGATDDDVARLELGPHAAAALAGLVTAVPLQRRRIDQLVVPLQVRALAAELTIAELRSIEHGDVILADSPAEGDTLLVAGERLVWRARLDQHRARVVTTCQFAGACGLQEWTMQDPEQASTADVSLDELPLRLTFELGRLEVPLAELETVGPGHVFDLGRDPQQAVDIMSAGRRIGRGEIVAIGPALGVRVLWIGRE
jgi:type III secretion protein Q